MVCNPTTNAFVSSSHSKELNINQKLIYPILYMDLKETRNKENLARPVLTMLIGNTLE